jgi:hypothetical protein
MKLSTIIIALFLIFTTTSFCQSVNTSVFNSTGGWAKRGYYQFEWSVGELALVDEMQAGNSLIVTNGFLQPYILTPGTNDMGEIFAIDEIKVFPNPAIRYVEINFFTKQKGRVTFTLYDAVGQRVYTDEFICYGVDLIRRIPLQKFNQGSYVLNIVMTGDMGVQVKQGAYKIVKID